MPLPAFLADTPTSVRRLLAAGGVALFAFMVIAVAADGQSSSGHYRTAVATTGSVDQVLRSVATIEPVTQAAVAFPIAGTVETVDVRGRRPRHGRHHPRQPGDGEPRAHAPPAAGRPRPG